MDDEPSLWKPEEKGAFIQSSRMRTLPRSREYRLALSCSSDQDLAGAKPHGTLPNWSYGNEALCSPCPDLFRRNDVPGVFEDNISRQKIKRAGRIRLVAGY